MNLRQQTSEFHDARFAHGRALTCEKRVNDHDYSNGRVTSKRDAVYWNWFNKVEEEAKRNKR